MNPLFPQYAFSPRQITPAPKNPALQPTTEKPTPPLLPTAPQAFGFTASRGVSAQPAQEPSRFQTTNFAGLPGRLIPEVGLPKNNTKIAGYTPPGSIFNRLA
jgi:hypothetical protein